MEEVLRFFVLRPPELKQPQKDAIALRPSTPLQKTIEEALARPDSVSVARSVALNHLAKAPLTGPLDLHFSAEIEAMARAVESASEDTMNAAAKAVEDAFGKTAKDVCANPQLGEEAARLADTLVCRKLAGRGGGDSRLLERAYKVLALVEAIASNRADVSPRAFLSRTLVVDTAPPRIELRPDFRLPAGAPPAGGGGGLEARMAELQSLRRAGREALDEILSAPPEHYLGTVEPAKSRGTSAAAKVGAAPAKRSGRAVQSPMDFGAPPASALRLSNEGRAALSEGTQDFLGALKIDPASDTLPRLASRIARQLRAAAEEMAEIERAAAGDLRIVRIGSGLYEIGQLGATVATPQKVLSLPVSHGTVRSVGVADLVVVRQALKRHERREISHVENILPGEHKSREHTRSRSTEETTTTERETTKEEERDLQTAERFELQRETESLLHEELSLQVGTSMSGSYGPSIEFTTSADFGMVQAKEEATRQASAYAKETTQRAASKITERVRQETTLRITETFQEANVHEIDNRGSAQGVTGVYQWIDKVYEAQVFNYGQRMMFDFVVPEPASLLLRVAASQGLVGAAFSKPLPFEKTAAEIDEDNYFVYAQRYDAQGVEPPPEPFLNVAKTFDGADDRSDSGSITKVIELPLPDGYEAIKLHVVVSYNRWEEKGAIDVLVAGTSHRFEKGTDAWWTKDLPDTPTGGIALGLKTYRISLFAAIFDFRCRRTARAMDAWRLKTHGLIKQAYLKQVQDYEEKLAAARQEAADQQRGTNPADNRLVERTELKRLAISTLTAQHFDSFGAVETGAFDLPQIDFAASEETGQIWEGGDPPQIASPMYLSIVDEIKERTGAPGIEVPQGEPWEVRIPTALVALRDKPGLPSWSKGSDGVWSEDP